MKRVKRLSPKGKVILVVSEETQDYVREALDLSREEAEEISFVAKCDQNPTKAYVSV